MLIAEALKVNIKIEFARHSWYFRNALVRANYRNAAKGIDYTPVYLERFFRNLLLGEQWDLRNRYLHIHPTEEWSVQPNMTEAESTRQVGGMSPDMMILFLVLLQQTGREGELGAEKRLFPKWK